MRQDGFQPNGISYNALTSTCGKGSMPEWALQHVKEMTYDELHSDVTTCNLLVSACEKGQYARVGLAALRPRGHVEYKLADASVWMSISRQFRSHHVVTWNINLRMQGFG